MISDGELRRGMIILRFVWGAILVSSAIYLLVGTQASNNLQTMLNEESYTVFRYVLYSITCITLIATWYLRRFLMFRKTNFLQLNQGSESSVLQRYFIASITSWALSEAIAVYGLILSLAGKNTTDLYILVAIAAVVLFLYRPRKEDIIDMADKSQGTAANGGAGTAAE